MISEVMIIIIIIIKQSLKIKKYVFVIENLGSAKTERRKTIQCAIPQSNHLLIV